MGVDGGWGGWWPKQYLLMELIELQTVNDEIHQESCHCDVCSRREKQTLKVERSDLSSPNCMHDFIKCLPLHFPLHIEQTVLFHRKEDNSNEYHSYSNPSKDERKKVTVAHQQLRGLSGLSCQNVQIYFGKSERILAKFELITLLTQAKGERISAEGDILYLQPYQPRPIVRIAYAPGEENKLDSILVEYLEKEEDRFKADSFKLNEEFLDWVFREYGEQVFFLFITVLYAKVFRLFTGDVLKTAIFFWTVEPHNREMLTSQKGGNAGENYNKMLELGRPKRLSFKPKLVNLKELSVYRHEKLFSFQEEYQQLIKKKIESTTKKSISAIKNKVYRNRLENFRNKLHQVYEKEQETIMAGIQEEKQFEYQHDSEQMARMLIPNMGPYTTLRQILNDERAFRSVFAKKPLYRHNSQKNPLQLPKMNQTLPKKQSNPKHSFEKSVQMSPTVSPTIRKRYHKLLTTPSTHE